MMEQAFSKSRRRRRGFTLMEVAVAAVLIAMLAAVSLPYMVQFLDRQRAQTTADQLEAVAAGIAAFANGVKQTAAIATASAYPGKIGQLANVIVAGSTVVHNSCGSGGGASNFNATAVTSWNASGPFVTIAIQSASGTVSGLNTPLGMIADSLARTPATTPTVGKLAIRLINVDPTDLNYLDQIVDGGDGAAAGILQWNTTVVNGVIPVVNYFVPVAARC